MQLDSPSWLPCAIFVSWLVASFVAPFLVFGVCSKYDRILLVVDDLDRCDNDQMLEIIESVMRIFDDPELKSRIQVAMLVEEHSLNSAITNKYTRLWEDVEPDKERERLKRQIIRENTEKIFLAHLRLPQLELTGINELFKKFMTDTPRDTSSSEPSGRPSPQPIMEGINDLSEEMSQTAKERASASPPVERIGSPKINSESTWSLDEVNEFRRLANNIGDTKYDGRWGPRSIRCLLTRYQLARAILIKLDEPFEPKQLVHALANADPNDASERTNSTDMIAEIAHQVS